MFEKLRERWTKIIHPVVLRLGDLDPSVLTWSSLILAIASFYLVIIAGEGTNGSLAIVGAVVIILIAGILDGLDGALARHQGVDGAYGDFLDHTIDRIVDVGLLIAIGMNSTFVEEPSSGYLAGLLTLLGSYMGTQAQSVGLDRIYGGFSRADRMVIILVSLLLAAWQAHAGIAGVDISEMHGLAEWAMLGNSELNGMTFALAISAWGGAYTFLIRFLRTRSGLLS